MKPLIYICWLFLLSQQVFSQTITWTGATDTNWNTASNWSTNAAPTATSKVAIPGSLARYPVLNANVTIQTLGVEAGATLTVNASKVLTIVGSIDDVGLVVSGTVENNGTIAISILTSATANAMQLSGDGQFTNNAGATLTAATLGFYGIRVEGNAVLKNQVGGTLNSVGISGSLFLSGSTSPEMVQNHGKMTLGGQIEKYAGKFHNYPCGVVSLLAGEVYNNGGQIINEGFFSAAANLNGPAADFINNGIIYIGGSSASYTNNAIRIFNNATTTSIFEFAASNNLTVEGIYKNDAATTSAGGYNQATNTFTPVGVPGGTQTLYAKITRPGGTCPQIVPFTIDLPGFLTQPAPRSICPGTNAVFSVTSTGFTSFQWQESADAAFTSPTTISTGGIYTVSSTTDASSLTVAHNAGVNGKYYRCVGSPGAIASSGALLTVVAGSSATIAYAGSPYLNVGTATVTFTGTAGGSFSATPTGLSLDLATGEINLAASTLGSYTVTYTVASSGGCPDFVTTAPVAIRVSGRKYVWTGAASIQWNNVNNWLVDGTIPTVLPKFGSLEGNPVEIPVVGSGRYPEVTTSEGARKVTIAANASLTVKSAGSLRIEASDTDGVTNAGTFTNNGTVLIDSSYNDGFVNQTGASLINTNAFTVRMGTGNRLENYGSLNNSGTFTIGGGLGTAILNHPAATITNSSTFRVSGGLTGGILNQGTVDNSGQFTMTGGVSGTLFINQEMVKNRPGATMNVRDHRTLLFDNQKLLENEGSFNVNGTFDRGFVNRLGATLRNKTGGAFDVSGAQTLLFRNEGLLENNHVFSLSGSANPDTCFYNLPTGEIENYATFRMSGGYGGIFNLGKFTHGSAGRLETNALGNQAFTNGGTFLSSAGCVITHNSATNLLLNLPNAVFVNKCATTFGSSRNPVINQGRYTHTAGSFTGSNLNIILQNSDYAEVNVPFISTGEIGKWFVNSDTLILGPQTTVTTNPSSKHGTPLTNTSTGYVHSQADFTISSTTSIIENAGKMVLGSQSTLIGTDMGTPIINTGNLTNEGSTNFNRFGGYGIDNSGTFVNKGRFETGNSDKSIFNNGGTMENSGVIEIDSVFRDAILQQGSGSSFTNTAMGQINIDFVFGNGINNTAGNWVNNGTLLIAQTDTIALSGVTNAGTFQNNKLMRIGGLGKIKQHGLYNTGTFTNTTNSQLFLQSAEGSGITNQGGTITNQSCAYIESIPAILNAAGTFSNAGIIKKRKDNTVAISNISANSGKIINEDADVFNVTGSNSGAIVSITSSSAPLSLCANTRTLTATPSGGTFSVTGPGTLAGSLLTATGVGTIVVSYAYNNDPSCPYSANQNIEVISTASPTGILTWTGSVDTDWNTACNWSPASVPTATNDVVIPNTTNKPTINTAAVAKSMEVRAGAVLTIAATKSLTINGSRLVSFATTGLYNAGTIHNNGQLILGNTGSVGDLGILSIGTFNNNTSAEITIDRATSGGVDNATGGVFANAGKMTIGVSASVGSVGLQNDATFNNNTGGEITINRSSSIGLNNAVGGTFTNAAKISIGTITPTLANGLYNTAAFINNAGGEITINNTTAVGLLNSSDNLSLNPLGNFTNAGKISIGATALSSIGLANSGSATFNNNAGGEIKIDKSTLVGLKNDADCIFNNAAKITIGATAGVGNEGIRNSATFNNNTGGEIKIDNSTQFGLSNLSGATFTNAAKLFIGASANVGIQGIANDGTFHNNAGEITVDRSTQIGIFNQNGTFNNAAKLIIGGVESTGERGIVNQNVFSNNAGGDIKIDKAVKKSLSSSGSFNNAAKITIGAISGGENGLIIGGTFDNTTGGEITIDRTTLDALFNSGSSFNNAGKITIGALASLGSTSGLGNVNTFNNNACGQVIVASGTVLNDASGSFTNAGLVQIANNLENNGTFTNNGVLKYGTLTGTVTNATNSSLIVNNTPTPIFTYGSSYNGVINGIFTDANAAASAGAFTAPNTFVPSGLPSGSQTLYAKITPQGGACSFVVPFTFNNTVLAPVFTTQPTAATRCAGSSVSFTAAATNATGYQWQLSTGGGWSNVPASAPYANTTTGTLTISNVTGLNGYQFRCVAIGATSNTNSDPASLTVVSKPTITLTALTQTLVEGNNPVLCDTDTNPVNSLQFSTTTGCVVGTPVWRVQVGSSAWSAWSTTAPVTQSSNNQPHRYQAACDANCASTYSGVIELTINYRSSTPQNVSLLVDGVTVKEGETKEICGGLTTNLTFNSSCAAGELVLYSVDGGEYSSVLPTSLVDNQFHNYRVRCRKSDGTPSCVESESGVMRLKIVSPPSAPTVSLSSAGSCTSGTVFSGQSSCGSLQTIWYNATTNVALPNLPTTFPVETTSYYARCQTSNGCLSEKSNVVTFTVTATYVAPVITASQEIVCTGTTVTVSANCPAGSQTFWNTGVTTPSFEVAFNNVTNQTYWAKCIFEGGCQSSESVRKDVYWNAFVVTMINVGQSKSGVKPANDKALWSSQFITKDGGPELEQSTQVNPTLYYVENPNKVGPRYWTINVDACGLGTNGSLTFDMLAAPEVGVPQSFNTHENNAPYFMYANREGWTELYTQNHPAYGFYQDNGVGGNVYDTGLPKALYKLSIRYWDQKGWGSIYPSTRQPQGNVLAYQEYWFRIQSKDGVGVGAARTAASDLSPWRFADAKGLKPADNIFAQVMPNPVLSVLRLQVQDSKGQVVQTTLTDASGRSVLSRQFVPETNSHQEEFGVSELPTGMYFLKVSTTEKQATLKVVKVE